MSRISVDLSRLRLSLHGVSAAMAEAAVEGLEAAIRRRLTALPPGAVGRYASAEVALEPATTSGATDARALRAMIADRLVAAICAGGDGHQGGTR